MIVVIIVKDESDLLTPCCVSQHSVKRRLVPRFSQRGMHLLLQFYIQLEIHSVEHGICPIAVFTCDPLAVDILAKKYKVMEQAVEPWISPDDVCYKMAASLLLCCMF